MLRSAVRNEARHYWRLMQMTKEVHAAGDLDELVELLDEFDTLREMTNWPLLKERCSQALYMFRPEQRIA